MRRTTALPFITIPDELVDFSGFSAASPGELLRKGEIAIENWDYQNNVAVGCTASVLMDKVAQHLKIPEKNLRLDFVLSVGTGKGRFPKKFDELARTVVSAGGGRVELRGTLEGSKLSSRLLLRCSIVLASKPDGAQPVSPAKPGSRLWTVQTDVLLEEPGDFRFPTEALSFKESFRDKPYRDAPWYFKWYPGNFEYDFAGATRLYVNTDVDVIRQRIDERDPLLLQPMMYDVISQILVCALDDEGFCGAPSEGYDYDEGSVGYFARNWLKLAFPEMPRNYDYIRGLLKKSPGEFHARLLAVAEMRGDGKEGK